MKTCRMDRDVPAAMTRLLSLVFLVVSSLTSLAAHAATLPTGFAETRVATGLASPTAMAIRARRAPVRRAAGRRAARHQERRAADAAVPHRQREFLRRARPARRRVRSEFRVQQLRVRLLHDVDAPDPQPPEPLHGQRRQSGRGGRGQRSAAAEPAEPELGHQSQRRRHSLRHRRQALHRGRRQCQQRQRAVVHDARWARCCASTRTARFPPTIPSSARLPASTRPSGRAACATRSTSRSTAPTAASTSTTSGQDTWEEVNHGDRGRQLRLAADRRAESGRRRGRALSDPHLPERRLLLRHHRRGVLPARHRRLSRPNTPGAISSAISAAASSAC